MTKLPRRRKNGKPLPPPPSPEASPDASPGSSPEPDMPAPKRCPVDELDARLAEPDEGPFLHGLERRVVYPTLVAQVTEAGHKIIAVLREHDHEALWPWYEDIEADLAFVRERAAFTLGWEHGSADGRAEFFRSQAPALGKKAKRLADQARALVVNGGMSPVDAAALLLECAWSILLTPPAPSYEG
jgi:hypothetical protein